MSGALYATNVYHYDHVLLAMDELFDDVGLVRRLELTPENIRQLRYLRLPKPMVEILSRRVREASLLPNRVSSLGMGQLFDPLAARVGYSLRPSHIRAINASYARQVQRKSKNYDYLHFVEGLGYKALSKNEFELAICERRNFHHEVFEEQLDLIGGFPINGRPDPITDVLEYEYANSDYILVYSQAVKKSFLSRGFEDERIKVVPIGIGPQLGRLTLPRHPSQLIYVGRGDAFKGLDVAVATVKAMGGPFRLKVAGPMPPVVMAWLSRQNCVDYLGILNRFELRQLYSTSAAMILPSTESFGLAAAEAVYHGLPLVCSDRTGIAEYLPLASRKIVAGRDPLEWASAVSQVLGDSADETPCAVSAIDKAFRDLTWTATARKMRETYESMVNVGT